MRTKIISAFVILHILGLLSVFSGCVEADPLIEDTGNESNGLPVTRAEGESPYYFHDHENKKISLSLNTEYIFLISKRIGTSGKCFRVWCQGNEIQTRPVFEEES